MQDYEGKIRACSPRDIEKGPTSQKDGVRGPEAKGLCRKAQSPEGQEERKGLSPKGLCRRAQENSECEKAQEAQRPERGSRRAVNGSLKSQRTG